MPKKEQSYDWLVKFLIIGDSAVGKTNILLRLCQNNFQISHMTTIGIALSLGIDFKIKTIEIGGKKMRMQIWDTAGQQRFKTITDTYYKGAMGILLVYSVTDRKSFQNIHHWMSQIQKRSNQNVVKMIVANKVDLTDHQVMVYQQVTTEEGMQLAKSFKTRFYEASAKQNMNIQVIFQSLAKQVMQKLCSKQLAYKNGGQSLKEKKNVQKQNKKCCK